MRGTRRKLSPPQRLHSGSPRGEESETGVVGVGTSRVGKDGPSPRTTNLHGQSSTKGASANVGERRRKQRRSLHTSQADHQEGGYLRFQY